MRVTKAIKAAIRKPYGTIGQMEAMAGIPSDEATRTIFWKARAAEVRERSGVDFPAPSLVVERAREVCYGLMACIEERTLRPQLKQKRRVRPQPAGRWQKKRR